jgi:structural maintenance of chromosome 3 (chondroitin sulfate proteoglycan 6)
MEEIDRSDEALHDLLASIDDRKDEAIMRTFKMVQKHFKEVFAELVPTGSASLVLKTVADDDREGGEEGDGEEGGGGGGGGAAAAARSGKKGSGAAGGGGASFDKFRGLAVQASFTTAAETQSISLLSGGQKSLVALALIFAINRADPAPFHVFDEIDSALDSTHRAAVAKLIASQVATKKVQFITSTFSPELIGFADKC